MIAVAALRVAVGFVAWKKCVSNRRTRPVGSETNQILTSTTIRAVTPALVLLGLLV